MEHESVASNIMDNGIGMPTQSHQSWYSALQHKLSHVDKWAFDLLVCGIISFVVGFVCKNFGRMLILGIFLALAIAYGVDAMGYYAVPWDTIQTWLGFEQVSSWSQAVDEIILWIKQHPAGFAAGALGFIIGWKVG
jgi:uncharacterized membrane protein (Fun14 family)